MTRLASPSDDLWWRGPFGHGLLQDLLQTLALLRRKNPNDRWRSFRLGCLRDSVVRTLPLKYKSGGKTTLGTARVIQGLICLRVGSTRTLRRRRSKTTRVRIVWKKVDRIVGR